MPKQTLTYSADEVKAVLMAHAAAKHRTPVDGMKVRIEIDPGYPDSCDPRERCGPSLEAVVIEFDEPRPAPTQARSLSRPADKGWLE